MGTEVFEVGLFKPSGPDAPEAVMIPRTWDRDTLLRSVPWLRLQNLQGRNIYIRPKGEHALSLVDDLKADAITRMKREGFQPAIVVETSPGNFQAWLRHPRELPRETSTAVARELARRFDGDLGAADWRHFGRLSGFTNRKPAHQKADGLFPFVRLIESSGAPYPEGERFVHNVETRLEEERARRMTMNRSQSHSVSADGQLKSIEAFRSNPVYGGDGTRVDLAYAIYALAHGRSEPQIREALRSRDLSHKGTEKRQNEYVERTVKKAAVIVSERSRGR